MNPKQVHIIRGTNPSGGGVITEAELSEYFGVPCIKGKPIAPTAQHWTEGGTAYFLLDKISSILVFDSEEEYRTSVKNRPAPQPPKISD
jgi:hypothetical protein